MPFGIFRINCRGHLKTNSEHEMLTSNEIRFSNEENDEPPTTSISIQHGSTLNYYYIV